MSQHSMIRRAIRPAALAASLGLALLLAGCAGTPTTHFYTLSAAAPSSPVSPARAPARIIAVGPVTLPDYLDRPQIVTRDSAYAIRLAPFDQWAGPLADMVPRVLVENIAQALPDDRIVRFPQVSGQTFAYRVTVDINRFDVDPAGTATLIARWQIHDRAGKGMPLVADETFIRPAAGQTYEAYAAAMSGTLADLAGRIADAIGTAGPAPRPAAEALPGPG